MPIECPWCQWHRTCFLYCHNASASKTSRQGLFSNVHKNYQLLSARIVMKIMPCRQLVFTVPWMPIVPRHCRMADGRTNPVALTVFFLSATLPYAHRFANEDAEKPLPMMDLSEACLLAVGSMLARCCLLRMILRTLGMILQTLGYLLWAFYICLSTSRAHKCTTCKQPLSHPITSCHYHYYLFSVQ